MKVAALMLTATLLLAQGLVALCSPEVHLDRTVTFRVRASQANEVLLTGEVLQGKSPQTMIKGSDGVWSITIGPLPPEIWIYNFRIAGVDLSDPANINLMPRAPGPASVSSFVEVSGDKPAFYDARPVPHGNVRMELYETKAIGVSRYVWVYTPPGYDKSNAKYPAFYLLHGNGETQNGWVDNGRANIILDNLIADGKAVPMVVVMPHGHAFRALRLGLPRSLPQQECLAWATMSCLQRSSWNRSSRWLRRITACIPTLIIVQSAVFRWVPSDDLDRSRASGDVPLCSGVQRRIWQPRSDARVWTGGIAVPLERDARGSRQNEQVAPVLVSRVRPVGNRYA
ncbi:MAG: alpha/beta hydrolase-fold protein [Acidobacteriota bacterium]